MIKLVKTGIITLLVLAVLVMNFGNISNKKEFTIKHEGNSLRIVDIGESSADGKYVLVKAKDDDGVIDEYVFDTKDEILLDAAEENMLLLGDRYNAVRNENDIIEVYALLDNEKILAADLRKEWGINENTPVNLKWSSTQKYLYVYSFLAEKSKLIDIERKEEKLFPVEGMVSSIYWSPDDTKAILRIPLEVDGIKIDVKTFIWYLNTNETKIIERDTPYLEWTPEGKYIYYFTSKELGEFGYNIEMYDITKSEWSSISLTDKGGIDDRYIKWISENEVIFPAVGRRCIWFKPYQYYAIKVNLRNGRETTRRLNAYLARQYIWSYDNKYIYFIDDNGFYKQRVGF